MKVNIQRGAKRYGNDFGKLYHHGGNDRQAGKLDKKGVEIMKEYFYVNDNGYHKRLVITEEHENGSVHFQVWCEDNGEFCGHGDMTNEELNNFLQHYGVQA